MKISAGMLPFELVVEVRDKIDAQVAMDRKELEAIESLTKGAAGIDWLPVILDYGVKDRRLINEALAAGSIPIGACYRNCHQCCTMRKEYQVEVFDILLSYRCNTETVKAVYRAGLLDAGNEWCGMLENGSCTIHAYKPYTCLLTLPAPEGAERGGCCFRGDKNAKTVVHAATMIVTGRMRRLFEEYLPELPAFAGSNMNQAFSWAVRQSEPVSAR